MPEAQLLKLPMAGLASCGQHGRMHDMDALQSQDLRGLTPQALEALAQLGGQPPELLPLAIPASASVGSFRECTSHSGAAISVPPGTSYARGSRTTCRFENCFHTAWSQTHPGCSGSWFPGNR